MKGSIEVSCTILNGTNKAGTLKKNDKGYYENFIVGALNMINSKNEFYDLASGKKFFDEASDLCRMAEKGMLRGEYGHPNQEVGQSDEAYVQRLLRIDEQSACCHHRRIALDFDRFKDVNGKGFVGIVSTIGPSGPYGETLDKQIANGEENVAFSIRCFSLPRRVGGQIYKEMKHVVTFDYVNEPGIAYANKYNSPALESHREKIFTGGTILRAAERINKMPGSNESMRIPITAILGAMGLTPHDSRAAKRNFMELMNTTKL